MLKKLRIVLLIPFIALCLMVTATAATATSGWKYTPASTSAQAGIDIDGPNGTAFVFDIQISVRNVDAFWQGNTSFWVSVTGPAPGGGRGYYYWSTITVQRGGTWRTVIDLYRNMPSGRYTVSAGAYSGWSGSASAYVN